MVLWSPRHLCSDKRTTHVQWWTIAFILLSSSSSNSLLVRPQLLPAPTTVAPPPTVNSQWVGLAFTNNTHNRFKSSNNSSSSNRVCWEGPCTRYSVGGLFLYFSKRFVEPWEVTQKALRWNVLIFFDGHAVLFALALLNGYLYGWSGLNRHALKCMLKNIIAITFSPCSFWLLVHWGVL